MSLEIASPTAAPRQLVRPKSCAPSSIRRAVAPVHNSRTQPLDVFGPPRLASADPPDRIYVGNDRETPVARPATCLLGSNRGRTAGKLIRGTRTARRPRTVQCNSFQSVLKAGRSKPQRGCSALDNRVKDERQRGKELEGYLLFPAQSLKTVQEPKRECPPLGCLSVAESASSILPGAFH